MKEKDLGIKGWLTGPQGKARAKTGSTFAPNALRIAVLPFDNMSPDPSDEYFADGMTEEVISTLSGIEEAEIISRTSMMQYKKAVKPVKEISRELDVGTLLEGSVRKAGNKLRVTVQMIDAASDRHVWSDSYDREFQDVFAIQTDIARRVADALKARIHKRHPTLINPTEDVEAYGMYLRGMQLYYENTEASMRDAIMLFEKAVSKDPSFVRGYVGLAYALCGLAAGSYDDFTASIGRAESSARKALALGPESAEAHSALAHVYTYMDKLEEVTVEAEKAIKINPNLSEAYRSLGWIRASMGQLDLSLEDLYKAYRLDPMSFRPGGELTLVLQLAGKEQEALDMLGRYRDLYPKNHRMYARMAEFYLWKKDYARAREMLNKGLEISPRDVDLLTDLGQLYAFTSKRREAQEVLQAIESGGEETSHHYGRLFIYAALGDLDRAFEALMVLAEMHAWPTLVKSLPVFQEMRKDPRFSEFCARVGLPKN